MSDAECIGCGHCCAVTFCAVAMARYDMRIEAGEELCPTLNEEWQLHGCPWLRWNGERWVCGEYTEAVNERVRDEVAGFIGLGEGCQVPDNQMRNELLKSDEREEGNVG